MNYDDETQEPGYDPGPCGEDEEYGECECCGEHKLLGFGKDEDECEECEANAAQFDWEDAQVRHAENGYGYSGGWSGHEPAYYGD